MEFEESNIMEITSLNPIIFYPEFPHIVEESIMENTILNQMIFYPGFPHIAEQIFQNMDKDCLKNCRLLSKSWLEYIDDQNLELILPL